MSEIIVGSITPAKSGEPVTVNGSKTIRINFLEHHLGKKVDVNKLCSIHKNNNNPEQIQPYDFVVDEASNTISISTNTKTLNFVAQESVGVDNGYHRYPVTNFNVTNVWQDVPVALNVQSGHYELLIRVVDANGKIGYYSSTMPFMSEQEQSVDFDSTTEIPLFHQGNDTSILELRIVRTTGSVPGSKFQLRGSLSLGAPHPSIIITMKRNFWGL